MIHPNQRRYRQSGAALIESALVIVPFLFIMFAFLVAAMGFTSYGMVMDSAVQAELHSKSDRLNDLLGHPNARTFAANLVRVDSNISSNSSLVVQQVEDRLKSDLDNITYRTVGGVLQQRPGDRNRMRLDYLQFMNYLSSMTTPDGGFGLPKRSDSSYATMFRSSTMADVTVNTANGTNTVAKTVFHAPVPSLWANLVVYYSVFSSYTVSPADFSGQVVEVLNTDSPFTPNKVVSKDPSAPGGALTY